MHHGVASKESAYGIVIVYPVLVFVYMLYVYQYRIYSGIRVTSDIHNSLATIRHLNYEIREYQHQYDSIR